MSEQGSTLAYAVTERMRLGRARPYAAPGVRLGSRTTYTAPGSSDGSYLFKSRYDSRTQTEGLSPLLYKVIYYMMPSRY
jgi:hypothetical protein